MAFSGGSNMEHWPIMAQVKLGGWVPIPFSVFPSAYRNAELKDSASVQVVENEAHFEHQALHGREGHEEVHESFSATVQQPPPPTPQQEQHHDVHIKEEVHIHEEERLGGSQHGSQYQKTPQLPQQLSPRPSPKPSQHREEVRVHEHTSYRHPQQATPQQHREEIHIHEETRYRQPQQASPQQQREEIHIHEETRYRQPQQHQQPQQQREEIRIHEETRYRQPQGAQPLPQPAQPHSHHAQRTDRVTDRVEFERSHDRYQPQPSSSHTQVEVQDRTYDRHFDTVHGPATDYAPTQIDVTEHQFRERTRPIVAGAGYPKETFITKHNTYPNNRAVDSVDKNYPAEVRVEQSARSTAQAPKKFKRDMGYYDNEGQYHSLRQGISKAAHKVADRVQHPIHPHRHQHSHHKSFAGAQYDDQREEIVVKEKYTTATPSVAPSRPVQSGAPVERVVRIHSSPSAPSAPARSSVSVASAPAPAPAASRASAHAPAPTKAPTSASIAPSAAPARPVRKMASKTITIPCHHIRIGDLLILQGRPCQVIRITTSSQTGQHRYLGVDLFTKQLHEESSFISNPAPSVVVQNMLGPVFKQYRVLDIREDGRVVAMTESGDVKQGLPVLDQSGLHTRLSESFDNGRGSVRILVIEDDGMEMAVDYKVVHGSRL
ncbi:hypothetical protein Ptr86124_003426 [Pyrenophora tritici-repentis]|uniref:Woronin body major protein n=2 Tax=Pyrenophora tritici-repentis TaxID=45151 RepID=A0A922T1V5_9PLEO|nr:hypothetical protein Ptr86124_003426 [Pyrenophora tritici-repentis]